MSTFGRLAAVTLVVLAASASVGRAQEDGAASAAAIVAAGDIEHGRYLVERVVMCAECHSTRDARGNVVASTRFLGGPMPVRPAWAEDWPVRVPRIAGLPGYSDAQALRLLTEGAIGRDGNQLRAPMPRFHMTPEDAADVIAYIRSL